MSLDLDTLRKLVANNPDLSQRCFIITADSSYDTSLSLIQNFYGEDNVNPPEQMGFKLSLVTVKDPNNLNYLVAKAKTIEDETRLTVEPVAPLPARVHFTVTGIPQFLISTYITEFMSAVSDVVPYLCNCTVVSGTENFVMEGVTTDLIQTRSKLKPTTFPFKDFPGIIRYKSAEPVVKEDNSKFNANNYYYTPW